MGERRVYYWGGPGSGKHTSVQKLVGDGLLVKGDVDYRMSSGSRSYVVRYSSVGTKFFYLPTDRERPKLVIPALERLSQASAVVFVADSQRALEKHNVGWLERLAADLRLFGRDIDKMPVIFQLNKRDLPDIMSVDEMKTQLSTKTCFYVPTVATRGLGVVDALAAIERMY